MEINILPPNGFEPGQMKAQIIQLNSGFISVCTYANNVELVTINMNDKNTVFCSKPLIKIDDNTYQIPD